MPRSGRGDSLMEKFRASYTVLKQWNSGQWDKAVKTYFKLESFTTREMAEGKKFHEDWEAETKKTGCLPKVFGGRKMKNPKPEGKVVVELADWLDLVFIIDCLEAPILHEYKTGKRSAEVWANSEQPGVYGVGATYAGNMVDRAVIHHYDQYTKKYDNFTIWLTDKYLDESYEWIVSNASEMMNYFQENQLFERYGPQLAAKIAARENH